MDNNTKGKAMIFGIVGLIIGGVIGGGLGWYFTKPSETNPTTPTGGAGAGAGTHNKP